MFQTCPATGFISHRFDKTTHQCKCGRWEREFKPKVTPAKPRAECQICERQQATDSNGCMVHHGYKRPGCGYLLGGCMGVGYKPYMATDALQKYLRMVQSYIQECEAKLVAIPQEPSLPFTYTEHNRKVHPSQRKTVTVQIEKGGPKIDMNLKPTPASQPTKIF